MKLEGNYQFEAPLRAVWNALQDPEVLAATLPGCDKLTREGNQFTGELNVKIGPVQGKFDGKVDMTDMVEPESFTMLVDGRGGPGFVKANARVKLAPEGGATRLDYDADVTVGGKIASVGQRLIDASARAIVKQSLEGLNERLKAMAPPPPPPPGVVGAGVAPAVVGSPEPITDGEPPPLPPPPPPPAMMPAKPTQAEFAARVAAEVTKELFPARKVALIVIALVLAFIAYKTLT
jgi:carbon monoxide dehydrogenase subunit G